MLTCFFLWHQLWVICKTITLVVCSYFKERGEDLDVESKVLSLWLVKKKSFTMLCDDVKKRRKKKVKTNDTAFSFIFI